MSRARYLAALSIALIVEARKAFASRVVIATSILVVAGTGLLAATLTVAASSGDEQIIAKMGALGASGGWDLVVGIFAQVTAAGGLLGFGIVLSWLVGREFAEGTVAGLFALPVGRPVIALAKLLVYLVWAALTAGALTVMLLVVGLLTAGPVDGTVVDALFRQCALTVFTAALAVPAAWVCTLGRGLLPGIATSVGTIVAAQVMVVGGVGAWFPFSAPALWAMDGLAVTGLQLGAVATVPLAFGALTLLAWKRLQLDR